MITEKPQYKSNISPVMQFVIFCGVTIGLLIAGSLLATGAVYLFYGYGALKNIMAMNLALPQTISAMWLFQIFGTTLPILFTPR